MNFFSKQNTDSLVYLAQERLGEGGEGKTLNHVPVRDRVRPFYELVIEVNVTNRAYNTGGFVADGAGFSQGPVEDTGEHKVELKRTLI